MVERGKADVDREDGSDLLALIELEERIARDLQQARAEAEVLLETARKEARRLESKSSEDLARAMEEVRAEAEAECRREIGEIERGARRRAERFVHAGKTEIDRLAARVVNRLLRMTPVTRATDDDTGSWNDPQDDKSADPGPAGEAS